VKMGVLVAIGWRHGNLRAREALMLGAVLALGGEFAFVVFGEAFRAQLIDAVLRDRLVAIVSLSMAATPLLVIAIGTHEAVLWAVLPVAVLVAAYAPRGISFAAGQAGFTVVLFVLFNLIQPVGWSVGLVRVEDVAIGFAISLGVVPVPVVQAWLIVALAAGALLAANALAAVPAMSAARSRPGPLLRTE